MFMQSFPTLSAAWRRGFETAVAVADMSDGRSPGRRMGAALYAGNKLLSCGSNLYAKSHPKTGIRCIHAELAALLGRRHYEPHHNMVMYVARVSGAARAVVSRPCMMCQDLMRRAGVRRVRFIDEKGQPAELRL